MYLLQLPPVDPPAFGTMLLQALVTSAGTIIIAVITGIVIFRRQKRFENSLARELEEFRSKLTATLQRDAELYKSRSEVIRELYKRFSRINEGINKVNFREMDSADGAKKELIGLVDIINQIPEFRDYFIANKIVLPKTLFDLLEKFDSAVFSAIFIPLKSTQELTKAENFELSDKEWTAMGLTNEQSDYVSKAMKRISDMAINSIRPMELIRMGSELPALNRLIETEFQNLLGS